MSSAEHSPPRLREVLESHPESVAVVVSTVPGAGPSWVVALLGSDDRRLAQMPLSDSAVVEHALSVADAHLIVGGRPRSGAWSGPEDVDGAVLYRASLAA